MKKTRISPNADTSFWCDKLNNYLDCIDHQAEEMFERLIKQMSESEGVTEELKVANQTE